MSCYDAARLCYVYERSLLLSCSFLHRDLNGFPLPTHNDAMAALMRLLEGNAIKLNKVWEQTGRSRSNEPTKRQRLAIFFADTPRAEAPGGSSIVHADEAGPCTHVSSNILSWHRPGA